MKRSSPRKAPLLTLRHALAAQAQHSGIYLRTLAKWLFCALLTGGVCGLLGTAFHYSIRYATGLRADHGWLLYLLPLAGLVIVALYRLCGIAHDEGTNLVLNSIRTQNEIPLKMTPLIFIGTVLTHLCGGSAGREGAALQIGGSIGTALGRLVRLDEKDLHIITIAGMSALFAALFGTPVTAAVFSMEVISVGVTYLRIFSCINILFALMTILNGVLKGAGDLRWFLFITVLNLGVRVVAAFLLAAPLGWTAVCWSQLIGWLSGLAVVLPRYCSGRWRQKSLIS